MTDTMTQQWGPVTHENREIVDRDVRLADAPNIRYHRRKSNSVVEGRPYSINFRFVRFNHGAWHSTITIYALRTGSLVGDPFTPDKVVDMPEWLADLITEATPA